MTCLPSKSCERQILEPFVATYNREVLASYEHLWCLLPERTSPQPEEVYVDEETGAHLVIERKSLHYPPSYPRSHRNAHALGEIISDRLVGIRDEELLVLELPYLVPARKTDFEAFGRRAGAYFREILPDLTLGEISYFKEQYGEDLLHCKLRLAQSWEFDDISSQKGFVFSYEGGPSIGLPFESQSVPREMRDQISQIYLACKNKFRRWKTARRILLLEGFGELEFSAGIAVFEDECKEKLWWKEIIRTTDPAEVIDEIWLGSFITFEAGIADWFFERLYPDLLPRLAGGEADEPSRWG